MPYLIVSTPRAGRWNHRLLVADSDPCDGMDCYRLIAAARKKPEGSAWLAVSRPVKQMHSARTGEEILILGDIDTASLNAEQKNRILNQLRKYLENDLEQLITTNIDWEREGKADPVRRTELRGWLTHLSSSSLDESEDKLWNPQLASKDRQASIDRKKKQLWRNKLRQFFMEPTGIVVSIGTFGTVAVLACTNGCFNSKDIPNTQELVNLPENICQELKQTNDTCQVSQATHDLLCQWYSFDSTPNCYKKLASLEPVDIENLRDFNENLAEIEIGWVASPKMQDEMGITSENTIVTPQQFEAIREYKTQIRAAAEALIKYDPSQSAILEKKWPEFYDTALGEFRKFLKKKSTEIKGKTESESLISFLNACSNVNLDTIYARKQEGCDVSNNGWDELKKYYKNEIGPFFEIIKLNPPSIE